MCNHSTVACRVWSEIREYDAASEVHRNDSGAADHNGDGSRASHLTSKAERRTRVVATKECVPNLCPSMYDPVESWCTKGRSSRYYEGHGRVRLRSPVAVSGTDVAGTGVIEAAHTASKSRLSVDGTDHTSARLTTDVRCLSAPIAYHDCHSRCSISRVDTVADGSRVRIDHGTTRKHLQRTSNDGATVKNGSRCKSCTVARVETGVAAAGSWSAQTGCSARGSTDRGIRRTCADLSLVVELVAGTGVRR